MLERFFKARFVLERFRASPVGSHIDGFAASLVGQGYSFQAGGSCLRHAVHLGRWLAPRGVPLESLDEVVTASFMAHLPTCDCADERPGSHERALARVRVFREYLQDVGVVPHPPPATPEEPLLTEFVAWMRIHRGLAEASVKIYTRVVRRLLERVGREPTKYTARTLRAAVTHLAEGHGPSTGEQVVTGTRMFLNQLAVCGQCGPDLAAGIPHPARWSQTTLPKHLPTDDVEKLLATCDRNSPTGLRDYAVLLLLARLGLRADDVINLRLTDLDWARATIRLRGKARREALLPLSQDVGDAVLAYVDHGRPKKACAHLFLTARAPRTRIHCGSVIARLVEHAIRRAGVDAPAFGSHLLRHSAATGMLRAGVSLDGIAAILRHRSIDSTVVYARVDQGLLHSVAQPWTHAGPATATDAPTTPDAPLRAIAQPWPTEVGPC